MDDNDVKDQIESFYNQGVRIEPTGAEKDNIIFTTTKNYLKMYMSGLYKGEIPVNISQFYTLKGVAC